MQKSFVEILAERDDEFSYTVKSTADIHNPERFARVKLALLPYQVKSFEAEEYSPWSLKGNKEFPAEPNSPVYSIKVVTGLPVPCSAVVQTMAMMVHIHASHLVIKPEDGDGEVELINKPEEVASATAQKLVGEKRIGEFIRELQGERSERLKKTKTREVYESFFTTHRGLENVLHKPLRTGYYMIETYRQDDGTYLRAEGPFTSRPDGNTYRDFVRVKNRGVVSENTTAGMYAVKMLIEIDDTPAIDEAMFEVRVQDMDSSRIFSTMVRASNPENAREMAVRQVAEEHRLSPTSLTAMAPKPARSAGAAW